MGMDGVPVDENGKWLYPFISWLCPRTEPQRQWWEKTIGTEKTFSIGGNNLWAYNTALRLLWMAEHEPKILGRTRKWLLIEDFLNFMLCGKQATDYTMASCTLLFDQATRALVKGNPRPRRYRRQLAVQPGSKRHRPWRGDANGSGGNRPARRDAGGSRGPRLPLRRAARRRSDPGSVSGRERDLGGRAGNHPEARAHARAAEDRGDGGVPRGKGHVLGHGRGGVCGNAGVVPAGVRLRGPCQGGRPRVRGLGNAHGRGRGIPHREPWGHVPAAHERVRLPCSGFALAGRLCRA